MDSTFVTFEGLGFSLPIDPVAFSVGGFEVKWYGVIIAFGFTLAVLFGGRIAYTWKMNLDVMIDVLIYGTIAAILGARIYYVLPLWSEYKGNLLEIFNIRAGGLGVFGGLAAGLVAGTLVAKKKGLNWLNLYDCAGMSFLIGQGIGRWGNFMNQESFGSNTATALFRMWSPQIAARIAASQAGLAAQGFQVDPELPVHPIFLYESLWCLTGFVILYIACRKFRKFSGQIFGMYGIWYGTGRFMVECFKTDSNYIGATGLSGSQGVAILLFGISLVLLIVGFHRAKQRALRGEPPTCAIPETIQPPPAVKKSKAK